jgi:hypothetical protein
MESEDKRILAALEGHRKSLAFLERESKRLRGTAPSPQPGKQHSKSDRREIASAILNLLRTSSGPNELNETLPDSKITLHGLRLLIAELQKRAVVKGGARKTMALRLREYLTEPSVGAAAGRKDRINLEHLARFESILLRISRYGWESAKRDLALLGGADMKKAMLEVTAGKAGKTKPRKVK